MHAIRRPALIAVLSCTLASASAEAIQISAPVSGAIVRSGTTVTVKVVPDHGETIQQLAFITRRGSVTAAAGALQADVTVPLDSAGPEFVVAVASLSGGSVSIATVTVIGDPGPLQRIDIAAPPALTYIGQAVPLQITGLFDDGVSRDVTAADTGTVYETTVSSVLGVHGGGVIQARARGTAQIVVSNRGRTAVATIPVLVPNPPDNRIPAANAGPNQTVLPEALVTLDGSGSSDPDGDPLTYRWLQSKGPAVLLRDPDKSAPYFVAPRVAGETILEFLLVVSDSKAARTFPALVRVTVRP